MRKMQMSPIIPFSLVYLLVLIAFCWWMIRFNTRRVARKEQQMREMERAEFARMLAEQERVDAAAHRLLANVDTMPPFPSLPPIIPAHYLDASVTPPAPSASSAQQVECLACWLDEMRDPWRNYRPLNGVPTFCQDHAYGTLARALSAQRQQMETGEKYP